MCTAVEEEAAIGRAAPRVHVEHHRIRNLPALPEFHGTRQNVQDTVTADDALALARTGRQFLSEDFFRFDEPVTLAESDHGQTQGQATSLIQAEGAAGCVKMHEQSQENDVFRAVRLIGTLQSQLSAAECQQQELLDLDPSIWETYCREAAFQQARDLLEAAQAVELKVWDWRFSLTLGPCHVL